ncbi:efflux RND transporter periplasmic adaptor subunit [Bacillus sp. B1-b2]|uniref:efflux RND transporter periplasmic adaptor subunit n=1 Tax=Bacillus sp. B1-b2 TaxID=2653201 RepID=UPI00126193E9|nr:HlyD family efflux transporter periplasmic adaptor subunit [Bacillus sp. B1-b2]KAB7672152.1 HlyD family efflux transporter periplasmic adaptor subunit [Bacillus sp. B1-b2]
MKKKKLWFSIASVMGVIVIAVVITFYIKGKQVSMVDGEIQELPITVQKAIEQELTETILVTGEIVPESEQKVFIEPDNGEISEYKVEENQVVKAGDPLFSYDSSRLDIEQNKAVRERDLIKSRAQVEQNQIAELSKRIEEAKNKQATQTPIEENTSEVDVPQEDINQLTSEKLQLELQYESTKSEVTSAQEQINEITNRKKGMTVVSKIDGIVVKVNKNIAKTEVGSSEPVVHIISSNPYKVIGTMSEFDAVKIQSGQEVVVRPKVFKDRKWNGVVESVSQFPNGASEGEELGGSMGGGNVTMYPFKVAITDDTAELRQGYHVSLEVKITGIEKFPVIPHSAIIDEEGIPIVYVLSNDKLERREVVSGSMNDELIQVTEGVNPDELIVTIPNEEMYDGMEVISFDEIE